MLSSGEDLIEQLREDEELGVGFASFGEFYSDFLTTSRNDATISATTYSKDHILKCIKEGLKYGTIEYKDIVLAIKEAKDES